MSIIALIHPRQHSTAAGAPTHTPSPTTSLSTGATGSAPGSHAPTTGGSSAPSTSSASSPAAVAKKPLVVLNNTTITGLAAQAAREFETGGWTVTDYANYQNDIISTCAYYDPDVPGAKQAAQALQRQFPAIKRVKPQFSELGAYDSPIVVILDSDFAD